MNVSKVPLALRTSLLALLLMTGTGGAFLVTEEVKRESQTNEYVRAVAADNEVSQAVKIAMVMGYFYESSNKHIGTPYTDKNGKGRPLTVCNGVTGAGVYADKYYTPNDCYHLERKRYITAEAQAKTVLKYWNTYDPFTQAVFIDFIWNKGFGNFTTSTMLAKANRGDLIGSCKENPRWNRGTVNGISTVLPGLVIRGDSNSELCTDWRM